MREKGWVFFLNLVHTVQEGGGGEKKSFKICENIVESYRVN